MKHYFQYTIQELNEKQLKQYSSKVTLVYTLQEKPSQVGFMFLSCISICFSFSYIMFKLAESM